MRSGTDDPTEYNALKSTTTPAQSDKHSAPPAFNDSRVSEGIQEGGAHKPEKGSYTFRPRYTQVESPSSRKAHTLIRGVGFPTVLPIYS